MELTRLAGVEVVICGHSHVPFVRRVAGTWFVNTGSVGRPDDGDPRACYAVMRASPEEVEFTHYRVPYDVERAAQAIREAGLPEDFARMVLEGKNLTAVQNHP
jgi:diadenosine tetraphosphatase ApaH/serine/threonine PP2A family protein phosphatase